MAILKDLIVSGSSRLLGKLYTNDIEIGDDLTVTGVTTTTRLIISSTNNPGTLSSTNSSTGNIPLIIGSPTGRHIAIDGDEIAGKSNATTGANLWLNYGGGTVYLSNGQSIYASNGTFHATNFTGSNVGTSSSYITNAYVTTAAITTANTNTINNADMITTSALDVKGKLHAVEYDLENIMDLGGSFVVAPTLIVPSSGSGTKTLTVTKSNDTTVVMTVRDPSITSGGIAGFAWANNYKVKVSGLVNNTVLGTCDGYINTTNVSSNTISLTVTMDAETVTAIATTVSNYKLNIMLYNTDTSSATAVTKPLGIYLQHYQLTNNPIINVWNGQTTTPKVRIGYLGGITYNGSSLGTNAQNSWGLYSDSVFLEGQIIAKGGTIAGWTIGDGYITTNSNRKTYDNTSYTGMTMTASGIGARGSADSYFNLSINGGLTAKGANITGTITASAGSIGGFHITSSGNSNATSADGGHIYTNSLYRHSGDGTTYEYEVGIKGDATENPSSTNTQSENLAFYARRIAKGAKWNTSETMFSVTHNGKIYAKSADITGKITANTGYIGGTSGWTIASQQLYSGDIGTDNSLHLGTKNLGNNTSIGGRSGSDWRLTVGQHFGVTNTGALYCNDIHATGGTISGSLVSTGISANNITTGTLSADRIAGGSITVGKINPKVYAYSNNGQGTGYAKLFTISHTLSYHNAPISFLFHNRGKKETRVALNYTNQSTATAAVIQNATYDGDTAFYYVSKGNAVYDVYFALAESYDDTYITDYVNQYSSGLEVEWSGSYYGTSLPSGAVAFTKLAGSRTSADLDNAATTATNYITYINATDGIKIHNSNDSTNYLQLNSTAIKMHRNNVQKMYLDNSKLQFTNGTTVLSQLDSTSQKFYDGDGNITAEFGANGASIGKTSGTNPNIILASATGISLRSGTTTLANYTGGTITLGQTTSQAAVINSDGMQVYKGGTQIAKFGQGVVLGNPQQPTFKIVDDDTMRLEETVYSIAKKIVKNGTVTQAINLKFSVSSIVSVTVTLAEAGGISSGWGVINDYKVVLTPSSQTATTDTGGHEVSYSLSGSTVTVSVTNLSTNYGAYLMYATVVYMSNTSGLSRISYGSKPVDSPEYALSVGNGSDASVVFPDNSVFKDSALCVDWTGNFAQQMSFASLTVAGETAMHTDSEINCPEAKAYGECFGLITDGVEVGNDGDFTIFYKILIKKSGFYRIAVSRVWSSVSEAGRVRVVGALRNGSYVGRTAMGRDSTWETVCNSSIAYLNSGDEIGMMGRSEVVNSSSGYSVLNYADIIITPVWFA